MNKLLVFLLAGFIALFSVSVAQDTAKGKISAAQKAAQKKKSMPSKSQYAIIGDLNNLVALAYKFRITPVASGGGGGSYERFTIPAKKFKGVIITKVAPYEIVFEKGGVQCAADSNGRVTQKW